MNEKDLVEVGKQTVKKKRTRVDEQVHTEPGENTKYINHSLRLVELPKIAVQDAPAVEERVKTYFEICADDDMKPSVAGLALALGIDRTYLWEIRSGRKGKNEEVANTLKRAMQILDLQMVDYMQNGRINPVSGIFLMKNNFGYQDKQEVVVTPNTPLGDAEDTKALENKYIDSVAEEV